MPWVSETVHAEKKTEIVQDSEAGENEESGDKDLAAKKASGCSGEGSGKA
jgi:hypothetical protein